MNRAAAKAVGVIVAAAWCACGASAYPLPKIPREQIPADMAPEIRRHVEALYSNDDRECQAGARALGEMGPAAAPAAPFLAALIYGHKTCPTPNLAAGALIRIGKQSVGPTLMAMQIGGYYAVRRGCDILSTLKDERCIPDLVAMVAGETMSGFAWNALRNMGDVARRHLLRQREEKDPLVRRRAVLGLAAFRDEEVFPLVSKALLDDSPLVRQGALYALNAMLGDYRSRPGDSVDLVKQHLLAAMKDEDPKFRRGVLRLVARKGWPEAAGVVAAAMSDPDPAVRMAAIELAGQYDDERVADALLRAARSADPMVRATAVTRLPKCAGRRALPVLLALLKDEEVSVRERAVSALGGVMSPEVAGALIDRLRTDDPLIRTRAARALGGIRDERVLAALAGAMDDEDRSVRLEAAWSLVLYYCGRINVYGQAPRALPATKEAPLYGQTAFEALVKATKDSGADTRRAAVQALAKANEPRALPAMLGVLKDPDVTVRLEALGYLDRSAKLPSLEPIREVARRDRHPSVRGAAMNLLARRKDPEAFALIAAALRADRGTASAAADALRQYGARAAESLYGALSHYDGEVRRRAAAALAAIDDPAARKLLAKAMKHANPSARGAAAEAVGRAPQAVKTPDLLGAALKQAAIQRSHTTAGHELQRMGARAVPVLAGLVKDDSAAVRLAAVNVLAGVRDPAAAKPLVAALDDGDVGVRQRAVEALAGFKDPTSAAAVCRLLRDDDVRVRETAVEVLGAIGSGAALHPLAECVRQGDWRLRWLAAESLGRLRDAKALEPLLAALGDAHWCVRRAGAEALGRIGQTAAVPALVAALGDEHWYVRASAHQSLRTLTGQRLRPDPQVWRQWLGQPAPAKP